jgi:FG-GAP repeat
MWKRHPGPPPSLDHGRTGRKHLQEEEAMTPTRRYSTLLVAPVALAGLVLPAGGAAASGTFLEPAAVLLTFEDPTPGVEGLFGWELATLGDVDGDGVREVIISEPDTETGTTYVYSGLTGAPLHQLEGAESDLQGFAVADVGDVTGDGFSDILSGAPSSGALAGPGRAYLYSGKTGALVHTFVGVSRGDGFGFDVAGPGDVSGDGRPDILISAGRADGVGPNSGRAYLFSGRTFGLIRTLEAESAGDFFGSAVGSADDIDGDGVPDLVVGARHAGTAERGEAYAFSGQTGQRLLELRPPSTGVDFGYFFATGVGDTNGDGTPDLYVADFRDSTLGPSTGRAAVYSGVDGSELHAFVGSAHHEGLGPGRGAGDVNGDGRPDLAVGSFMSSDGAPEAGQVELYSGADGTLLRRITSTTRDEQLGFDVIGFDDVTADGVPEVLAAAANGDTVYLIEGKAS